MELKLFEIRDSATFIPAMGIIVSGEHYLLRRAGYGNTQVILLRLSGGSGTSTCDPYEWGSRTMETAHEYIRNNWDDLKNGEVIDVEFILGETKTKKVSEQFEDFKGFGL